MFPHELVDLFFHDSMALRQLQEVGLFISRVVIDVHIGITLPLISHIFHKVNKRSLLLGNIVGPKTLKDALGIN